MKTKNIIILLFVILLGSCVNKTKNTDDKKPFKPALEQVILQLTDSLKDEIDKDELLSIEFNYLNRNRYNSIIRIFFSDWYSSGLIDGYAKFGNSTIAFYNLRDDSHEMINKNNITFFVDTIIDFRDICVFGKPQKQFFYSITDEGIKRILFEGDFPAVRLIRSPKCREIGAFRPPEEYWFFEDSIRAEEDFEFYKKEVEYYRNRPPDKDHP